MAEIFDEIRQKPYSFEAEQSVIGSILLDPACIREVAEFLRADDFYTEQNRLIYEAMMEMFNENLNIDPVTVLERLRLNDVYEKVGGKSYLFSCAQFVPTSANVKNYGRIIEEKAYIRQLIDITREINDEAYAGTSALPELLDSAEQKIYNITTGRKHIGLTHIKDVIFSTYEYLNAISKDKNAFLGIKSHFGDIDRALTGFNNSDLILLAARPGMGKTSFALNIGQNIAIHEKKAVAIFSLEMSKEQLVARMLSSVAEVDSYKFKTGEIFEEEWTKIAYASSLLGSSPIYFDDTAGILVTEMKAKLRRVKNLGFVIIDYIQLMQSSKRSESRTQEVSEISRSLKLMAKDLNIPVMVLSQLSRGPEQRSDHRPMLSDLRESGAIEQDADVVMMLYKDDYYNPASESRNICECNIVKNRHGAAGKVDLSWQGQFTKFSSMEKSRE